MAGKVRPVGVTVISIFYAFAGGVMLLGTFALLAFRGFIANRIPDGSIPPQLLAAIISFGGFVLIFIAAIALVAAWGLWMGRGWSWYLVMALSILGALSSLVRLPSGLVGLVIDGVVIWYLWQPRVKAYFGMGPTVQAASVPVPPTVSVPAPPATGEVVYCSKCGAANAKENVYCQKCGAELKK